MAVIKNFIDKMHKLAVKFILAYLPEAKKPYNLKTVHQEALDTHEVAGKADAYGIGTDPKVIEDGLNEGLKLIGYLAADGWRIKTSLFNLRIRVPGEYEGNETSLPEGVFPVVRLGASAEYRDYIKNHVRIEFDGFYNKIGYIAAFLDVEENETNTVFVPGDMFIITGTDIRVAGNDPSVGVYFSPVDSPSNAVKVSRIATNTKSQIVGVCPQTGYQRNTIVIKSQYMGSPTKFLKKVRTIESSFVIEEA